MEYTEEIHRTQGMFFVDGNQCKKSFSDFTNRIVLCENKDSELLYSTSVYYTRPDITLSYYTS